MIRYYFILKVFRNIMAELRFKLLHIINTPLEMIPYSLFVA